MRRHSNQERARSIPPHVYGYLGAVLLIGMALGIGVAAFVPYPAIFALGVTLLGGFLLALSAPLIRRNE